MQSDKDKALEITEIRMQSDKALEISALKHEHEMKGRKAFYSRHLGALLQIVVLWKSEQGPVYDAILRVGGKRAFDGKQAPSMSNMDRLVRHEAVKTAVWDRFQFDQDVPYPKVPSRLLYGVIPEEVHEPELQAVLVSDRATPEYRDFLGLLCKHFDVKLKIYSEEAADGYAEGIGSDELP